VTTLKVKCPKCKHEFDTIENPAPVITATITHPNKRTGKVAAMFMSIQEPREVMGSKVNDLTYGVKIRSGYKDIFKSIDKHKGATWTEMKSESKVSTATLAKRLHEGKADGLLDEDIRKSTGKKIYKLRQ